MILTGTPVGVAGHHGNRWLRPGDLIEAEVSLLGFRRNRCVAPKPESAADHDLSYRHHFSREHGMGVSGYQSEHVENPQDSHAEPLRRT
ncbi:fumarylacetoacetate hydrolase family protein [Nocardia aobensis]|uniref:Fumarylacetoacetate hydrolase family protein n=1 Tax=Nocardia aobensis TaxID=257277 RepID=A0ABW6PF82_9NOCA